MSLFSDYCLNHTNTQLSLLISLPNYHTWIVTNFWDMIHTHTPLFYQAITPHVQSHVSANVRTTARTLRYTVCMSSDVCTGSRVSSHFRLTAELSWSEGVRPSDRENRGIKHYHQKRLGRSLLRPHSFLQSSCSFVCSFVVSVRIVRLFESMHFSASITWWEKRCAKGKRERKKKVEIGTERWGHLLFLSLWISIQITDS